MKSGLFLLLIGMLLAIASSSSKATTIIWSGGDGTGTDFADASNWVGGVAPTNNITRDIAQFATRTIGQPMIYAGYSVAGIDFATTNGGWTLSGAGPLTLGSSGIGASGQSSGTNTVSVTNIILGATSSSTWNIFSNNLVASTASTFNLSSSIQLYSAGQLVFRLQRTNSGSGVGTLNLSGPITGASSILVKFAGATYNRNTISIAGGGSNSSYTSPTAISQVTVNFDRLANTGVNSSFGASGTITLGDNSSYACVNYLGTGGATGRQWMLGGSGGGGINNNGSGPISFTSTASAVTGTGSRRLQLGGSNTGNNTFAELVADTTTTDDTRVNKVDGGNWVLSNPGNSYTGPTALLGGTLQVSKLSLGGANSCIGASPSVATNFVFSSGTLNYTGTGDSTDRLFQLAASGGINNNGSGPLNFINSGAVLHSSNTLRTLTLGGSYAGTNIFAPSLGNNTSGGTLTSLTKSGTTTWIITGANTYSGATIVSNGTLVVNGSLAAGSAVNVQGGGTLGGTGTIGGPVTVRAGGTLRPGAGGTNISTLAISNTLSLADASLALLAINRNAQNGSGVKGITTATYGGTLTVTNVGPALQIGDTFTLFRATTYYGWFTTINLPPLGADLGWDTTRLGANGTISVVSSSPITVTPSSIIVDRGGTAVFTASVANTNWVGYQWYDNGGSMVPGATNANLTLTNVQPFQAGRWTIVVSNLPGVATNAGSLAVNAPPPAALYPQGDTFCFTFYSTQDADSVYSLANGATAIGPYYGDQSGPLGDAISLNTKYLYKVTPPSMAGLGPTDFDNPDFVWPSDQTISNETVAILNAVSTNLNIGIWDIEPEELRPWKPMEMHYLALVSSLIHSNDPFHRPAYMYEPNHRTAAQLAQSGIYQDICAKGTYVNAVDSNFETNRIWARWSMEQELGGIAAGNTSAVPAIVLWMAADPPAGDYGLITNWCRHDAYMGLIMGGKSISIWSGARGRTGFSDTNFQAYLNGYLTVAEDLNGPLQLAPVFLHGQAQSNVTMTVTSGPATLQTIYSGATNIYSSITWRSTVYNGTNYLFMVNSGAQPVTATFTGLPDANRTDLFADGTSATPGGSFSITVPGLTVQAFQFDPVDPAPPLLSVQRGPGESSLEISWPLSYTNYLLQAQTNPPGAGLGANWAPVAGVISNQISLPIEAANGSVVFRLIRVP